MVVFMNAQEVQQLYELLTHQNQQMPSCLIGLYKTSGYLTAFIKKGAFLKQVWLQKLET